MQLGPRIGFRSGGKRFALWFTLCGLVFSPNRAQEGIHVLGENGVAPHESAAQQTITDVWSVEAERMQTLGDSLLFLAEKPAAALAMFRKVEKRTYAPCQLALAYRGIAQAHARTLNLADARVAAEQAEVHLNACDNDTRLELVKALVEIQIHLGQEETAERLVRGELQLHPEHPELRALLARIAFIQGDWFATNEAIEAIFETIQLEGATDQNLAWLQTMSAQSFIKKNRAFPDSIQNELLVALAPLPLEQRIKHREDVLKILKSEPTLVLDALEWARSLRAIIPRDHREEYALASLEVARCAQRTGSQSIAILHFHDAKEGAELSGNKWLLAEVLRQQAVYQAGRNDTEQAIESYRALDSVNLAIASSYANQNNRPIKRFTIGTLNEPDPFDQALQLGADSHAAGQTGAWPWVVALLALGLLTLALHNREMRRSLRTERSRIIRLRSLIPVGRLPAQDKPHTRLSDSEIDGGAHWAFHPGLTDESHPEYQHIASFLKQLDAELAYPITWDVPTNINLAVNDEVRETLRTLLRQFKDWGEGKTPINVEIVQHELEWKFSVTSDHTRTSREMSSLFAGKESGTSRWQGLYDQLQKLAARVVVERLNNTRERLTITLPLGN